MLACSDENEIDQDKPIIDISFLDAFPTNCDTIYFGDTFRLRMLFSDNVELGSFSINIHNNFNHHSHSTELAECIMEPVKDPITPLSFIEDFDIPDGLKFYETNVTLSIPDRNGTVLFDDGDYHFFISLTDAEGWSAQKGLSIKMYHRQ